MGRVSVMLLANWHDSSQYPVNILTAAPRALVAQLGAEGLSGPQIEYCLWRWQFLRRHPAYQAAWCASGGRNAYSFGLDGGRCPDPAEEYPDDLGFFDDTARRPVVGPHGLVTFAQHDPILLSGVLRMVQSTLRFMYPGMMNTDFSFPNAKSGRKRAVRAGDLTRSLRVLDALAADASLKEIERVLGNSTDRQGRNLKKRALDALVDYTGIPLSREGEDSAPEFLPLSP